MKAIGVFDSGIGGLTVVKELTRQLPYEDIVYLGDTARVPYGTKSESTIIRFTLENILFLLRQDVKFVVIACNTASSIALELVKKYFQIPIIGVIKPGAKEAARVTRNKRVGVIGTTATIRTAAYEAQLRKLDPGIKVTSCACPLFVPLVEEGQRNPKIIFAAASQYLKPLKKAGVDTLILGCTHYPLLKDYIRARTPEGIEFVEPARMLTEGPDAVCSMIGRGRRMTALRPCVTTALRMRSRTPRAARSTRSWRRPGRFPPAMD